MRTGVHLYIPTTVTKLDVDIVIIGSGFSGSLLALIIRQLGLSCVVLDKASHPRFAIGESSTPIANMILRDLCDRYELPEIRPLHSFGTWRDALPGIGVGKKRGFSYFRHRAGEPFAPSPDHADEMLVAASTSDKVSDTQWLRADVDEFLARQLPIREITLLEGVDVTIKERHPRWQLEAHSEESRFAISSQLVVDASGASGVLPNWLGIPRGDDLITNTSATFSHFAGVHDWHDLLAEAGALVKEYPFRASDSAVHHLIDGAWMWQLRFASGLTSAGIVSPGTPPDWAATLKRYPSLAKQFESAQLAASPGQLINTKRLQRIWSQAAGPDWILLPHTAGFVDPLHSTGIAMSLAGVEAVSNIISMHWDTETLGPALMAAGRDILRQIRFLDVVVASSYRWLWDDDGWYALTPYFLASIKYEQSRLKGLRQDTRLLWASDTDLLSDIRQFLEAGSSSEARILSETMRNRHDPDGLFMPNAPNMYWHTAPI